MAALTHITGQLYKTNKGRGNVDILVCGKHTQLKGDTFSNVYIVGGKLKEAAHSFLGVGWGSKKRTFKVTGQFAE